MSSTTEARNLRVFKSVQCDGLDDGASLDVVCVEVTDGRVVIDSRVQITAEAIMMVCKGRHSDKRVKLVYRDDGAEHVLYLQNRGIRGRVRGNEQLYSIVHDALIHHADET